MCVFLLMLLGEMANGDALSHSAHNLFPMTSNKYDENEVEQFVQMTRLPFSFRCICSVFAVT